MTEELTGRDFRRIRLGLGLTQRELAGILGYAQKIRISEYERATNPVAIPSHIQEALLRLQAKGGVAPEVWGSVREWTRHDAPGVP
jgi:transcriptional regulator with XRE-family HTH domain